MSRPSGRTRPPLPSPVWLAALATCLAAASFMASAELQPLPQDELLARVAGTSGGSTDDGSSTGGDSGGSTSEPPFSIASSATDLNTYVMDCMQLRDTFMEWRIEAYASTVANRSAYYLGVDVKLYTKYVLRKQKFEDSYGPISAISTSVVYTAPCHEYEEAFPEAKGWHKGIDERGDEPIYRNTSDR